MSDKEIKNCPFCGGKNPIIDNNGKKGNSKYYYIICSQYCGAEVHGKQKQWAIKAWNTRDSKQERAIPTESELINISVIYTSTITGHR